MKRTQRKDAFRNILKQKVSFLSMVCVILVGITGLLEILGIADSLKKTAEEYYSETRFRDAEITYALGLSEDSLAKLENLEPIRELEAFWSFSAMMQQGADPDAAAGESSARPEIRTVHVLSRTERISTPVLVAGQLPETGDECALDEALAKQSGLAIGDWIRLTPDLSGKRCLNSFTFRITGLIHHPHSVTTTKADTVLLPTEAFKQSAGCTSALALLDIPEKVRNKPVSDEYLSAADAQIAALQEALPDIADARMKELFSMLEENALLKGFMEEKELTADLLLDWLSKEDADWENADPRIQALRPYAESLLESRNMELADAAALLREIRNSRMVVQDRRMNEGYEYVRSIHQTILRLGIFFSPLFALVGSIVFFSSTLIIISDQKYQVGAMKAIGFDRKTIRNKYLLFGLSAALAGSVLGIALSQVMNRAILRLWNDQFALGELKPALSFLSAAIMTGAVLLVSAAVIFAACRRLLKCSAVGLISGTEPAAKKLKHKRSGTRKRSLYSELILNNLRTEKTRTAATVIVIAASVLLIGAIITIRMQLNETFRIQMEDVAQYDLTVTVPDGMKAETLQELEDVLTQHSSDYTAGYLGGTIAETQNGTFACAVLCMERDLIRQYFHVGVPEGDGVCVSYNLSAAYRLKTDTGLSLYSRYLSRNETKVAGVFDYHIGTLMVIPAENYQALFGSKCGNNRYFVKCSADALPDLQAALKQFNEDHTDQAAWETTEESMEQYYSLKGVYNVLLGVTVILVILMNLIILVNLTSILLNRRMKDLLLMRVNGFSMRQVSGYFFREITYTMLPGIVLGIAAGIPLTLTVLRRISTMKVTLAVGTVWWAWVVAAGLCAAIGFLTASLSFRKVRNASLINISRY